MFSSIHNIRNISATFDYIWNTYKVDSDDLPINRIRPEFMIKWWERTQKLVDISLELHLFVIFLWIQSGGILKLLIIDSNGIHNTLTNIWSVNQLWTNIWVYCHHFIINSGQIWFIEIPSELNSYIIECSEYCWLPQFIFNHKWFDVENVKQKWHDLQSVTNVAKSGFLVCALI